MSNFLFIDNYLNNYILKSPENTYLKFVNSLSNTDSETKDSFNYHLKSYENIILNQANLKQSELQNIANNPKPKNLIKGKSIKLNI